MSNSKISMRNVHKDFSMDEEYLKVLDDINIEVSEGEFISIIGPSGCGKSTIFHILTKLVDSYEGEVEIDGMPLSDYDKRIGYMHQKDLLMPWRTVIDNVIIPLEIQGEKKSKAREKVKELLPVFGLEGFENVYPNELSGGMRQRAALLRTVLVDSDIMLLDEPFGALDAINRTAMQNWLLDIWSRFERSVMFITHDIEEAIFLSDRVYVLTQRPARVLQEIKIDFERPRKKEILISQKFLEYKKILMNSL